MPTSMRMDGHGHERCAAEYSNIPYRSELSCACGPDDEPSGQRDAEDQQRP